MFMAWGLPEGVHVPDPGEEVPALDWQQMQAKVDPQLSKKSDEKLEMVGFLLGGGGKEVMQPICVYQQQMCLGVPVCSRTRVCCCKACTFHMQYSNCFMSALFHDLF